MVPQLDLLYWARAPIPQQLVLVSPSDSQTPPLRGNCVSHGEHPCLEMLRICFSTTTGISCSQGQILGMPGGSTGKKIHLQCRRCKFELQVGKIPWKRAWQPTPVFLPGEFHGQRSLVGYSPEGCKESDMTEVTEHTQGYSLPLQDNSLVPLCSRAHHGIRLS